MRAVVFDRYGGIEQLRVTEVPRPVPGPGQVLVEVVATALNLSDWEGLRGSPYYARLGDRARPRPRILGSDIAGVVVATGPGAVKFRVGDEVYGDNLTLMGGFAEFALAPETALASKPAELSFAEAATIPQSGAIATQAIARARPGDRVLINGAGGGTGVFSLQLAREAGLHVTGVDNGDKQDFMRELGADETLDYRAVGPDGDFTRTGPYDLIVDFVASKSVFAYRRALARGGTYLFVGGTVRALLRVLTVGWIVGAVSGRRLRLLAVAQGPDAFEPIARRVAAGEVRTIIDRTCSLEQVPQALARHGEGRALGKVVIAVREP
jgi:NADPH:quinone reductase-like Zn-dependent oxidoreductase